MAERAFSELGRRDVAERFASRSVVEALGERVVVGVA
jgi:hypothetical protein